MPRDAETSPPDGRVMLPGAKGVQVGDGNEQVNQFIATYVERQVVVVPTEGVAAARTGWGQGAPGMPGQSGMCRDVEYFLRARGHAG